MQACDTEAYHPIFLASHGSFEMFEKYQTHLFCLDMLAFFINLACERTNGGCCLVRCKNIMSPRDSAIKSVCKVDTMCGIL